MSTTNREAPRGDSVTAQRSREPATIGAVPARVHQPPPRGGVELADMAECERAQERSQR